VNAANNTWDAAAKAALSPSSTREPPPAIPPVPFLCVAPAPYVNNTAAPPCF
jgi:hypothetical protein